MGDYPFPWLYLAVEPLAGLTTDRFALLNISFGGGESRFFVGQRLGLSFFDLVLFFKYGFTISSSRLCLVWFTN